MQNCSYSLPSWTDQRHLVHRWNVLTGPYRAALSALPDSGFGPDDPDPTIWSPARRPRTTVAASVGIVAIVASPTHNTTRQQCHQSREGWAAEFRPPPTDVQGLLPLSSGAYPPELVLTDSARRSAASATQTSHGMGLASAAAESSESVYGASQPPFRPLPRANRTR